jgi:hypothetical protein
MPGRITGADRLVGTWGSCRACEATLDNRRAKLKRVRRLGRYIVCVALSPESAPAR